MEMYGNIRCVSYKELVPTVISEPNYKKKVREGKIRVVRPGKGLGNYALIDYDNLHNPIKVNYDTKYPNATKEMKNKQPELLSGNTLLPDSSAIKFYREYEPGISMERQEEYVMNAQVMNEMVRTEKRISLLHKKGGYSHRSIVWETVLCTCEKLRDQYGHTLPKNAARLRQKFNEYKRLGYICLVNGNLSNQVARKIGPKEAVLILKLRRSKVPVYTESQIFDEYNRQANIRGLKPIKSPTTLKNFLFEPAIMPMWYASVHGMQAWKAKYATQQKTRLPQMRDALWYSDGTKLNLYYRDDQGKMRTTSVYEVVDAYSETLLGYDIAPHENFDSQYRAYRMSIEFSGVRPYEIVTDNQGGHTKLAAQGFFKKICSLHKPTQPYNGQSKTIESVFGRFQQQVLHKIWYFTGQNVTAKKLNSKPNMEFIEQNAYALPTLAQVKEIYRECRDEWNNMPHPGTGISRIEMYRMSENPDTVSITDVDMIQMFWLTSKEPITYTNKGIVMELQCTKYHYDVYATDGLRDDSWAMKNTGRRFHVMYDPMDMTRIELWEPTASGLKYSAMATPKVVISRATQERSSEESSFMRRTIERSKELMALVQLEGERFDTDEAIAAEFFGLSTPKPKNVSRKKMDEVREKFDAGKLQSPIKLPRTNKEENEPDYATTGEYTKAISNMTFDSLYDKF
ncbi:MAG: hypothetical protein ACK5KV_00435 [Bacteroides graminisolvens]|uniref:hypothetical protein n=1 Tax=Bacteroides graminisolvens TaxID=477666 RepID=UPI003A8A0EDF